MGLFDLFFGRKKDKSKQPKKPVSLPDIICQKPWFNCNEPNDQKLTISSEAITEFYDIDLIDTFETLQNDKYDPKNNFVFYQQWGPVEQGVGRSYYWLDIKTAERLGKAINAGYVKSLIIICTTFQKDAIRKLADTINSNVSLDLLGFFWYFSGDSIVDEAEHAMDIGYLAEKVYVKRISILTGEYNNKLDDIFIAGFQRAQSLEKFAVFQVDDEGTWPQIPTPKVDELLVSK